jgi:hypothetical protein
MNLKPTLLRELLVACLQRDFDDRLDLRLSALM